MRLSPAQQRGLRLISAGEWRKVKRVTRVALKKKLLVESELEPDGRDGLRRHILDYHLTATGWAYLYGYEQGFRDGPNRIYHGDPL